MTTALETPVAGLQASPPAPLPFAPELVTRAFLLERRAGDVLVYSAATVDAETFDRPIRRAYLGHWHEAAFGAALPGVPLFVHAADRDEVARRLPVRAAFTARHVFEDDLEVIPIPGHTPGATAYLWDSGHHRFLFTGDTVYLRDGEWVGAVLASSDRAAYLDSLALMAELDFDVLVPWASSAGQPAYAVTSRGEARRRLGAIAERVRRGEDH